MSFNSTFDRYYYDLDMRLYSGFTVTFVEGLGEVGFDVHGRRDFEYISSELFPRFKADGLMMYGEGTRFDDRKYRLNFPIVSYTQKQITVPLGLTVYARTTAAICRADAANLDLMQKGVMNYNDEWAYFARTLGVAFVPVTLDGTVFLGQRVSKLYSGYLNCAAGNSEFHGTPLFSRFFNQAVVELREEFGSCLSVVGGARFAGIASNVPAGDGDCVWIGRVPVRDSYFLQGEWLSLRSDAEHGKGLVAIRSLCERDELVSLLSCRGQTFPGMMASTRLGLESLGATDFEKW